MQGAAKPAVNEPMAYSKLKAVTAGTASDPANGTAQTAPSEGSAQRSQVYICLRLVTISLDWPACSMIIVRV